MLDYIHDDSTFLQPPDDPNTYTLGSIGKHNVVICCLPKGKIGNNSAAVSATQMARTFPSIKIGLMVGIGGGVPPKVRLGDVVISAPVDQYQGVVQWDFGKAEQGGKFRRTGGLNNAPNSLLTALTKMETNAAMRGSKILQYLEEMEVKWPKLVPEYTRSASLEDPLSATGDSAAANTAVDTYGNSTEPRIHYGLIASGNRVIKDEKFRDALNESLGGNLLCVEMEAAGLMDNFPCIVIRGICDYADSQKDKCWQEYAATVAAACAKELLECVRPSAVDAERPMKDTLGEVLHAVSGIDATIKTIRSNLDRKEDFEILNWLTPLEFNSQQNDYIKRRQPGTGQWLLDSVEFQNWLDMKKGTLFCPGIPGAGKTILTSVIIDDLCKRYQRHPDIGIAYIYCHFRSEKEHTLDSLLASVLKQLAQGLSSLPSNVRELYDRHKSRNTRPSCDEIVRTLHSVAAMCSKTFIVIDALDELSPVDGCRKKLLFEIFKVQTGIGANIIATSRFIPSVEQEFEKSTSLEIRASNADIQKYVDGRMMELSCAPGPDLQCEIMTVISQGADGMFLLAALHLESLKSKTTVRKIRIALDEIRKQSETTTNDDTSRKLDPAYKEAMTRIKDQNKDSRALAEKVLPWIVYCNRALTVSEIQHALSVEVGMTALDPDNIPDIHCILSVCAGLVTIDIESDIVRLAHYTTQEYLQRKWTEWFPDPSCSHEDIASVCITYLSFDTFVSGPCAWPEFDKRLHAYPLYKYAACNWALHTRASLSLGERIPLVLDFLEQTAKVSASAQVISREHKKLVHIPHSNTFWTMEGIHLSAYMGLEIAVRQLVDNGYDPDTNHPSGYTPLSYAATSGHIGVVKLLLTSGRVNPNPKVPIRRSPLDLAVAHRHTEVAKLLIATKAVDIHSKYGSRQTLLHRAVHHGQESMVKLLLTVEELDLNSEDIEYQTLLHWGARHKKILSTLLATKCFDSNYKDKFGMTPLHYAAMYDCSESIKCLLAIEGTDINATSINGETPLHISIRFRAKKSTEILLSTLGVDLNIIGNSREGMRDGGALLSGSCERLRGSSSSGQDSSGRNHKSVTPLHLAVMMKYIPGVQSLLDTDGVQLNAKSGIGWTALHIAVDADQERMVKLLADRADVNERCVYTTDFGVYGYGRTKFVDMTSLHIAALKGSAKITELLLAAGAKMDFLAVWKGTMEVTPLHLAVSRNHLAVVKILLEWGADISCRVTFDGISNRTPLQIAKMQGQNAMAEMLLEHGAEDVMDSQREI